MKRFLLTFLLLLASSAHSVSQSASGASVNIVVNSSIGLTNVRDMNFGVVVKCVTSAIISPITGGGSRAYFTVHGAATTPVVASFSTTNLTSGANSIAFTGSISSNSASTTFGRAGRLH
ncbi:MAG TPA: hypothetical protein VIS48_00975 [Candidatus Kryptonia bacterium]